MHSFARILPLAAVCWLLAGCGYVGDPLPPSLNIPVKVTDLRAIERGDNLVIDFTAPDRTTDDVALRRLGGIDLRVGPQSANWATEARQIEVTAEKPSPVHVSVPIKSWDGLDVLIAVRTAGRHKRYSAWSDSVRLQVVTPLETPPGVKVQGAPGGIQLTWAVRQARAGIVWRVSRRTPQQALPELLGTTQTPEYLDKTAQFGKTYEYTVQAELKMGDVNAESEVSQPISFNYEDIFPPTTPSGLSALAGLDSIQLTWTPDTDPDLKGYYLYRAAGNEPLARLGGILESPAYTDREIRPGVHYRYEVSAVDLKGNESPRSAPVEAMVQ
jgi:hypothetical protein